MNTVERATTAVMSGRITDEEWDLIVEIQLRVERQITCPTTGLVLDTRSALLVKVNGAPRAAIHRDGADAAVERLLAASSDVDVQLESIPPELWDRLSR